MNLSSLFFMSILTSNVVLTKFLGICPFLGTSKSKKTALGMGLSVMVVMTLSSILTYVLYYSILLPTNTTYLKTILFILVIACFVQLADILLKKYMKNLHKTLGIYLPLITTNCAVLGIVLLNINNQYNLLETIIYSIGSSLGFTLVLFVFSSIRERLDQCEIPSCFKGTPIALIVAGIMSLLFGRYLSL